MVSRLEPTKSITIDEAWVWMAARTAYEVVRAYRTTGLEADAETDEANWYAASDWQREQAINNVHAFVNATVEIGGPPTPEDLHLRWRTEKESGGWAHGDLVDSERKTHPFLVPYSELPIRWRVENSLFHVTMVGLLRKTQEESNFASFLATQEESKDV